ncbi:MAG: hypothetical protein Q4D13_03735 [Erysipelotrichaceae bacterium]|nr:hypothetical protein [Erysipelotrichaceae bacterium]
MRAYLKKSLYMLPALLVLSLGISLTVMSSLGSDCLTSFQQGIGRILNVQVGTVMTVFNLVLLAIFVFVERKYIGIGSILIGFCLGGMVNVFNGLLSSVSLNNMAVKIMVDIMGIILVAIALSWYIPLNVGLQPLDMLKQWIAKVSGQTYGISTYILSFIFLCGAFLTGGDIGIGTILNLLLVGKLCDIFMSLFKPVHEKINQSD